MNVEQKITQDIIEHTSEYVHIEFPNSRRVLSSAPHNGGLIDSDHLLILRVMENFNGTKGPFEPLADTFRNYCRRKEWAGITVGMMTSARMTSFRNVCRSARGVEVSVLVTAGISNARRAGDPAEYRSFDEDRLKPGTINIIILTNAILTQAAQVEAVMVVTEAKAAVLQDLDVTSPVTGKTATGTGTDAITVVSGSAPPEICYCGKHTLFGEKLASATMDALFSSLGGVL
ncbi:MAG: adenosylcobinamide amidohydrolase [Thermodesulfobacteriota bacterium]|nr:adenosylcobinamide amidohydrolase [Thermodesulfobacteriota bacterium]